jgi:hypothetical protein
MRVALFARVGVTDACQQYQFHRSTSLKYRLCRVALSVQLI